MNIFAFGKIVIASAAMTLATSAAALPEPGSLRTGQILLARAPEIVPRAFEFDGNVVIATEELNALAAQWIDQPLDFTGLSSITDAIRALYHSRGYLLAVAYLPPQQIENGVIRIGIMEGKVGKITVNSSGGERRARVSEEHVRSIIAAHVQVDATVSDAMLERPLLLIEDLAGSGGVRSALVAGDERGSANLEVDLRGDPRKPMFAGSVELDNFGNRVTGEERLHLKLDINGLANIGDQLTIRGFVARNMGSTFGTIAYLAPLGGTGLRAGFGYGRLAYALGEEFSVLDTEGKVRLLEAYLTYPFLRSRNANMNGRIGLVHKKIESESAFFAREDIRDDGLYAQLSGDHRAEGHAQTYALSWTAAEVRYRSDAQRLQDEGEFGYKTAGWFHKLNFDAQHMQQLMPNVLWSVRGAGQYATKNLIGAEKFSLGGSDRVRAYQSGEASGDLGWLASTELRLALPQLRLGNFDLSVSGFYDYGEIRRNRSTSDAPAADGLTPNRRRLDAYGIGFRFGKEERFVVRSDLAWPGGQKAGYESDHPRVWLQSILWF